MSQIKSPPSYAPTSTTTYTPSDINAKYHQEITKSSIVKSPLHKSIYESLAEIYSIIMVLEMVENSFLKDYITDKEKYTSTTLRLINQYQMILRDFKGDSKKQELLNSVFNGGLLNDLSNFLDILTSKFSLSCTLAIKRLQVGVPATIEHLSTQVQSTSLPINSSSSSLANNNASNKSARLIAEITGSFITCMDALKLNYKTKDRLHPLLSELVVNLNNLVNSNENDDNSEHKVIEFQGKSKLVNWLIKLNNLNNNEELSQDEIDSFLNDLDFAYKGFYISLE